MGRGGEEGSYSEGSFQGDEVLSYTVNGGVGDDGLAIFQLRCHIDGFPLHWRLFAVSRAIRIPCEGDKKDLSCREDILDRLCNFRTNAIAFDQSDGIVTLTTWVSLYIDGVHACMHPKGEVHRGPCFL